MSSLPFGALALLLLSAAHTQGLLHSPQQPQRLSNSSTNLRIVGGSPAALKEFPYQVQLYAEKPKSGGFCGGSIIDEQWVLTGAHCFFDKDGRPHGLLSAIHFGGIDKTRLKQRDVEDFFLHPEYRPLSWHHDFALIKIKGVFPFDDSTQPILLAPRNYKAQGNVTASGWGDTVDGPDDTSPRLLLKVTVPLLTDAGCLKALKDAAAPFVPSLMLCAGFPEGGFDTCQGDSGGPVIQKGHNGQHLQVGVVSWGVGCARPALPGVYSRVSAARQWIDNTIAKN